MWSKRGSALDKAQRELIDGYLAKARDKARVARELFSKSHWDDAVSRAYYAAFHAAQAALLAEGQRVESHTGVVTLFGLLLVKTGKFDKKWASFSPISRMIEKRGITKPCPILTKKLHGVLFKRRRRLSRRLSSIWAGLWSSDRVCAPLQREPLEDGPKFRSVSDPSMTADHPAGRRGRNRRERCGAGVIMR